MEKLYEDIKTLITEPFVGQLDILHLFLLVGLVIVFAILWNMVIGHIALAALQE